jgi:DNA-binding MarR family transcriptional regulator
MELNQATAARELARQLRRSSSTVSEVIKALRAQRVVDAYDNGLDSGLSSSSHGRLARAGPNRR